MTDTGSLIEGVDYFVRVVPFPNAANQGAVFVNDDGTFDIYLNALYPELTRGYEHEVRHILRDHFYKESKTIAQVEAEADGAEPVKQNSGMPTAASVDTEIAAELCPETKTIPVFRSMDEFLAYMMPAVERVKAEHPEIKFA